MSTGAYQEVLERAKNLSRDEQNQLLKELATVVSATGGAKHSILELEGLGAEIWRGIDAQQYVREERDSWDR